LIFYEKKAPSLCAALEAGLMRSQANSERLIQAVVRRMLPDGDNA
jgi:ribosomal protein L13